MNCVLKWNENSTQKIFYMELNLFCMKYVQELISSSEGSDNVYSLNFSEFYSVYSY